MGFCSVKLGDNINNSAIAAIDREIKNFKINTLLHGTVALVSFFVLKRIPYLRVIVPGTAAYLATFQFSSGYYINKNRIQLIEKLTGTIEEKFNSQRMCYALTVDLAAFLGYAICQLPHMASSSIINYRVHQIFSNAELRDEAIVEIQKRGLDPELPLIESTYGAITPLDNELLRPRWLGATGIPYPQAKFYGTPVEKATPLKRSQIAKKSFDEANI